MLRQCDATCWSRAAAIDAKGGAAALVRSNLHQKPPEQDIQGECWWLSPTPNLVAKSVGLQGTEVLVMGSYHRDKRVLDTAAVMTKNGALPFLLLGDFNDAPENPFFTSWACSIGAAVVVPNGGATCNPSRGDP